MHSLENTLSNLITEKATALLNILSIGASYDKVHAYLNTNFPNAMLYDFADSEAVPRRKYNYIILEEDLHEYSDPVSVLQKLYTLLTPSGKLILLTAEQAVAYTQDEMIPLAVSFGYTTSNSSLVYKLESERFLTLLQPILHTNIDNTMQLLLNSEEKITPSTELKTLSILAKVHAAEKQDGVTSFFDNRTQIETIIEVFNILKFYIRRMDFGLLEDANDFIQFIKEQRISGHALYHIIRTTTIHTADVANQVITYLLEHDEPQIAMTIKENFSCN